MTKISKVIHLESQIDMEWTISQRKTQHVEIMNDLKKMQADFRMEQNRMQEGSIQAKIAETIRQKMIQDYEA
jgi:hypothetical protein